MSEKEPRRTGKFRIEIGQYNWECTPENTRGYMHVEEPYGDHIFIIEEETEDSISGHWLFREQIKNFSEIIEYMNRTGFTIFESDKMLPEDKEKYEEFIMTKPVKNTLKPLSDHSEKKARFLGYILLHDHLTPDDFNVEGNIII